MESQSNEHETEMETADPHVVEIIDVYLTDGRHLRFNSTDQNLQCVDFQD
jgi:hypothetical protein